MLCKKHVLSTFTKFIGNTHSRSSFSLVIGLEGAILLKKRSDTGVLLYEILQGNIFIGQLQTCQPCDLLNQATSSVAINSKSTLNKAFLL